MTETIVAPRSHSHSRLQAFTQCPLAYKLSYIDKVGTDDSDVLEIGAAAHEFFEHWVTDYKEGWSETDLLALAAQCFQKEARDQSNFKDYLAICRTFAENYKPDPNYGDSISELKLAFDRNWKQCDWFAKDVYFRAKIDRIDKPDPESDGRITRIKIVDYKTGFAGAINSFQLDVYGFVSSLVFPDLEKVEVEFYYTKSGFRQNKVLEIRDMGIVKVQLEALMDKIESEKKFKAKPGARCLNCGVAAFCKEKPSDLVAIAKSEDAEQLATDIAVLEAQAKAKKKSLKVWVEENGPVKAAGLVYSSWPRESMNVDFAPVLELCVKHSVDPAIVFNPDTTVLKKLIRTNKAFADAIIPYIAMEVSYSFSARKGDE